MQTNDIKYFSEFFDIKPDQFLSAIGLTKANGNGKIPGVGSGMNPLRGFQEYGYHIYSAKGIREKLPPITYNVLREIENKNPIISAIVNLRNRQMRPFAMPSVDDDQPGYRIVLRDSDRKPTKKEQNDIAWLKDWFYKSPWLCQPREKPYRLPALRRSTPYLSGRARSGPGSWRAGRYNST